MDKIIYEKLGETQYFAVAKSGLRVFVVPKAGFSKTYALYATCYGSIDNCFEVNNEIINIPDGTAHFLEHKMFEQKDGGNAFDVFGKYGASANAFTSFDTTAYLFDCQRDQDIMLRHLLSYVNEPYFTDENVTKEQGIIGQEIKMYADDPGWVTYFNMVKGMYKSYPVNIEIAGSVDSISEITPELLYKIHQSFYHPENMVLCVAGNCDPVKVLEIVDETVPVKPYPAPKRVFPKEQAEVNKIQNEAKMSVSAPVFNIGFKESFSAKPGKLNNIYSILLEIMFGRTSDFYLQLLNSGKVTSFSKGIEVGRNFVFAELSGEGADPYEVNALCLTEIERRKKVLFDDEEFDRAKKLLYGGFVRSLNSVDSIAYSIASAEFSGYKYFENALEIMSVSRKEVEDVLKNGFTRYSVSVTKPKEVTL